MNEEHNYRFANVDHCTGEFILAVFAHGCPSTLKHALTASSHLPAVVPSHIEAFEEFNVARSAVGGCFREANPSIVRYKRFPALCEGIASTFFVLHANIERCQFVRAARYLPTTLLDLETRSVLRRYLGRPTDQNCYSEYQWPYHEAISKKGLWRFLCAQLRWFVLS